MSTIEVIQCDQCLRILDNPNPDMSVIDLDFCNEDHLQRYIAEASKGERAAVLEALMHMDRERLKNRK